MHFQTLRRLACIVAATCVSTTAGWAGTITNGDFSDGLNGYTEEVCAFFCSPDPDGPPDFASIAMNGSDPYLQLLAPGSIFGNVQVQVQQSLTLGAANTLLTFDAGLISFEDDLTTPAQPGERDGFVFLLRTETEGLEGLFTLDDRGGAVNAGYTGSAGLSTTQNPTGSFFDFSFTADLSAFAGQDIDLFFIGVSRPDARVTRFGVDNVALSAPPVAPVPLPAGALLLLSGTLLLSGLRKR